MRDKSLIISKLTGGGSRRPADVDYALIADHLRLFGGRTAAQYAEECRTAGVDGHHHFVPKPLYDNLLDHRQQLLNSAVTAIRALLDYDQDVLSQLVCADAAQAPQGLPEAIRACAPLVTCKGDWAALYMLAQEQGIRLGYTEFCRLVGQYAPQAPQPRKQDIAASEWDTNRRRFPDWEAGGMRYEKFRRHYMIAKAAYFCFTNP